MVPGQPKSLDGERIVNIIHHAFRRGGGKERCAVSLAAALRKMGWRVIVHAMIADAALAKSLRVELNLVPVSTFPRALQSFRFFKAIEGEGQNMDGLQIAFSRVP